MKDKEFDDIIEIIENHKFNVNNWWNFNEKVFDKMLDDIIKKIKEKHTIEIQGG